MIVKTLGTEIVLRTVEAVLAGAPLEPTPAATPPQNFDRDHLQLMTDKLSAKVDELSIANERLTALVELGQHLASERDPLRILQDFCRLARHLIGATFAAVGVLDTT